MATTPSASVFTLPLPSWAQPSGSRVSQYDRKRKNTDELDDETTDVASRIESEGGPSLVLTPNESHQYRVAGFPFHQELPQGRFPHGPPRDDEAKRPTASHHLEALADLSPPIYPPQTAEQTNIRFQHLGVLTAILHRCMLQGDYVRAGRAWGLILRETYRGSPMDVRNETRWGIGAEILLRRGQRATSASLTGSKAPNAANSTFSSFTPAGFAQAKEYYERLILNHPYTKTSPQSVSSLHFYPAMFGLWVYVAQEESNSAREDVATRLEDDDDEFSDDESGSDIGQHRQQRGKNAISSIRARELGQAQQIAVRLDQLLGSPPYSDSAELLELRGMVSLWIGDLLISSIALPVEFDEDYDHDAMHLDEAPGSLEARRELRLATDKKSVEVKKSAEFFEKAQQRGKNLARNLESFHIKDFS
ncbi:unnamed protein product [Penicillium salamii]|nr:unnamed protein product [Penicillium salamii]CAG8316351.1 unnamed protein product [Penicillium salamii]